ncbi:MAG: 3-deoxy-manno-octulosonate cytidylyltransferase [Elusimicrobia bacterium]|nr:3-deoxy-manno-octulosonate cytidylyltransferase [Elusimicrobiota bacterium]
MSRDFLVVIPARLASVRFPRKPLALLGGTPVVEWCRTAAVHADIGPVLVATEDPTLARTVEPYGATVVMTSRRCASGSDRVWEAASKRRGGAKYVMNLQGDEPLISASTIRKVAEVLRKSSWADVSTAVVPITDSREADDPNVVKAALGEGGRCLYFSRAPIPFPRAGRSPNAKATGYFRHIGIYAFRRAALARFVKLPPSGLERRESLEQLRALEAGMAIAAAVVDDETVAIDTPDDLRRAERLVSTRRAAAKSLTGANHG